jgi:hypothetical protein
MHSPKVAQLDFSVQVVRHNLKIFAVENFAGLCSLQDKQRNVAAICGDRVLTSESRNFSSGRRSH